MDRLRRYGFMAPQRDIRTKEIDQVTIHQLMQPNSKRIIVFCYLANDSYSRKMNGTNCRGKPTDVAKIALG